MFSIVYVLSMMFPDLDKLPTRTIKCVFLGYYRLQKGYECYSHEIQKYYLFAYVTLFEPTPFPPT